MDAFQLRNEIVKPALEAVGYYSLAAEALIMGTAAQESHLQYVKQLGNGPALGLFQMEPATHDDIWDNFLKFQGEIADTILEACGITTHELVAERLVWDLRYATIMCRMHYLRRPEALPDATDIWAQAAYWKTYYNTERGAGTEQEFVDNYRRVQ